MNKFQIGDVTVTRMIEIETPTNPLFLYPDMVPEAFTPHEDWLKPHFMGEKEGRILMAIQSFIVESEGARIMVDTLKTLAIAYPKVTAKQREELDAGKKRLASE